MDDTWGRCVLCGEVLDIDSSICRACGEDNARDGALVNRADDSISIDAHFELDQLGEWSQVKHEILDDYASAYTTILTNQKFVKRVVYIDAFAGAGVAEDRASGELVHGSPLRALNVRPEFDELHFIERNPLKADVLRDVIGDDGRAHIHVGDADDLLRRIILPRCRYKDYARALCLLDPYGLSVDWSLLCEIASMGSVEIFFNFMVVGANRNVLWTDPDRVSESRKRLMDRCWGTRDAWVTAAYEERPSLFGDRMIKRTNEQLMAAYCERLRRVAGFKFVPPPIPMKNTRAATIYYLVFASPSGTGAKIVGDIFNKHRR